MRIGILGGTFDPIHYGHLRVAEETRETFALDRVLLVPSATPPHKENVSVSATSHRMKMVEMAIRSNAALACSDVESRRSGASYSVETLHTLRRQGSVNSEFYFIVGLDAFLEIDTWHAYTELFELSHFVVVQRPGWGPWGREAFPEEIRDLFRDDHSRRCFIHPSGYRVYFRRFRLLEISGSDIREVVRSGRSIQYLTPGAVVQYILRNGLYAH